MQIRDRPEWVYSKNSSKLSAIYVPTMREVADLNIIKHYLIAVTLVAQRTDLQLNSIIFQV